ncbi:gag/pol protein [Cucumis melo var. makuwa]|uniref:Gag/pol protein n=1 Tax=Cucumis melo var. makuwa TaxID=1194695 RepID=A0A5D3CIM7_CUCMM|nr:gag/pol protein [Cucumis melo var. makuwa]
MKKGTSAREHVLDMMMHFNIAEVNGGAIDEANQVSFILESLPKSFIPFQTNASLNKIEFNLTTLLNELQRFQNLTMDRKEGKGEDSPTEQGKEDYRKKQVLPLWSKWALVKKLPNIPSQKKSREGSTRKIVLGKNFLRARSLSKLELKKWSQLKQWET